MAILTTINFLFCISQLSSVCSMVAMLHGGPSQSHQYAPWWPCSMVVHRKAISMLHGGHAPWWSIAKPSVCSMVAMLHGSPSQNPSVCSLVAMLHDGPSQNPSVGSMVAMLHGGPSQSHQYAPWWPCSMVVHPKSNC